MCTLLAERVSDAPTTWFAEGDGLRKRQFATVKLDCADLLLLRKSFANRALVAALTGFGRIVDFANRLRPSS